MTSRYHGLVAKMGENGRICSPETQPSHNWRETFAFFPVMTISGRKIWWKKVYVRKFWYIDGVASVETGVEYGDVFDVLENP